MAVGEECTYLSSCVVMRGKWSLFLLDLDLWMLLQEEEKETSGPMKYFLFTVDLHPLCIKFLVNFKYFCPFLSCGSDGPYLDAHSREVIRMHGCYWMQENGRR